jgi:hypothetical protein
MKARLQERKDGKDGLTVGIVEEAHDPEDCDKLPAIGGRWGGLRSDEGNTASRVARHFPQHESRKGVGLSTDKARFDESAKFQFQISMSVSLF